MQCNNRVIVERSIKETNKNRERRNRGVSSRRRIEDKVHGNVSFFHFSTKYGTSLLQENDIIEAPSSNTGNTFKLEHCP